MRATSRGSSPAHRLVEKNQFGLTKKSLGNGQAAHHAVGQAAHRCIPAVGQVHPLQQLVHLPGPPLPRHALQLGIEVQQFGHPGMQRQPRVLRQQGGAAGMDGRIKRPAPQHIDLSAVGPQQAYRHRHQRGLARAVAADQSEQAARRHVQIEAVQRPPLAVALDQSPHAQGRDHRSLRARRA
jgi:hypothetical protein